MSTEIEPQDDNRVRIVMAKEYDSLKQQLEAANKACAEMRDALSTIMQLIDNGVLVRDVSLDSHPNWAIAQLPLVRALSAANHALSSDCGKDKFAREQVMPLVSPLQKMEQSPCEGEDGIPCADTDIPVTEYCFPCWSKSALTHARSIGLLEE